MSNRLWVGTTGSLITGHVLDCSKQSIERQLQRYDAQLYLKWNARKLRGWGCWELRRRPEKKSIKEIVEYNGKVLIYLDYIENGFESHVMDVPFINQNLVEKIKKMDTWRTSNRGTGWAHDYEYRVAKHLEKKDDERHEELHYSLKQMKSELKDLKEYVLSGNDPSRLAKYWDKKGQ